MEAFDLTFGRGRKPRFDEAPAPSKRRIHGVDYLHLRGLQSGDLFLTRGGWAASSSVLPSAWFTGDEFRKPGRALAGATGAVYHVPTGHPVRSAFSIVVKFSRFGQDVGITVAGDELAGNAEFMASVADAEFLPPFEEFGNLERLRARCRGRFATMQPLGIYSPPTRHHAWQLGRKSHLQGLYSRRILAAQEDDGRDKIDYQWERIYILLYRWLDGLDAEQACGAGLISRTRMAELTRSAAATLRGLGWMVLDHKPRHIILRQHRLTRQPLVRHGKPVYGLIDYELLLPRA